jgi:hypothetical protein
MIRKNRVVYYTPGNRRQKPMIRLVNRFLLKYGFIIGTEILVEYKENTIIIRKNIKL